MFRNYKKGFTLIELLVVIAIIGILSSVVLASLNTARERGADAAKRSSLNNMRAQAELHYDDGGTYTGLCTVPQVVDALAAAGVNATTPADCDVAGDGSGYAMEATLSDGSFYCVDHTGFGGDQAATKGATATVCN